jgi:hypothetical protein
MRAWLKMFLIVRLLSGDMRGVRTDERLLSGDMRGVRTDERLLSGDMRGVVVLQLITILFSDQNFYASLT